MAIRVLQVGLGPIGCGVARQLLERPGFELAGAVDIDPAKEGRDVAELCGVAAPTGVRAEADLGAALGRGGFDAAVLCTRSSLESVLPLLESLLQAPLPVVSTTEELAYPQHANPDLARHLNAVAQRAGVALVGTGVNPGFAMDVLPITLSAVCERVDSVRVDRIQDACQRRLPFQKKIGAGMTEEEFLQAVDEKGVRHVGLAESVAMIADAFGWRLSGITDEIRPKIAAAPVASQHLEVPAGRVCGLLQDGVGYRDGEPVIQLHMEAYLGAPDTYDEVRIEGSPALTSRVLDGIPGDVATVSITVNCIPRVLEAPPGLQTMLSLPIPRWAAG